MRQYFLLGGILNNVNALNYYMSRDFPRDLLSENAIVKNIVSFAKKIHEDEGIVMPYSRMVYFICAAHKIPIDDREDHPILDKYNAVFESAEEEWEKSNSDSNYMDRWQAELKWAIEDWARRTRLDVARKEYMMMKASCFGNLEKKGDCDECEVKEECYQMKKLCMSQMKFVETWREQQEERIRKVINNDAEDAKVVIYSSNFEERETRHLENYQKRVENKGMVEIPYSSVTLTNLTGGW